MSDYQQSIGHGKWVYILHDANGTPAACTLPLPHGRVAITRARTDLWIALRGYDPRISMPPCRPDQL